MRRILRFALWSMFALMAPAGALFWHFVYTPAPDIPRLSGRLMHEAIAWGGRTRTYLVYAPRGLRKSAPLVVALHGSGGTGAQLRMEIGYGLDRLAEEHGFAVAYPDGYDGYWNACNIAGDYSANTLDIDDVGFVGAMIDKLAAEIGIDRARVFAAGVSRGGHMAFRLALEAPLRFRAVAAVSANVPAPENFKCRPAAQGTPSVMIMNGTEDPLNPFAGGDARLLGLFMGRGRVLSSRESGQYFADRNGIAGAPRAGQTRTAGGIRVEQFLWRNGAGSEVELLAIHGGGHGMPQPYRRAQRILGPSLREPDGPAVIWAFFARQPPR